MGNCAGRKHLVAVHNTHLLLLCIYMLMWWGIAGFLSSDDVICLLSDMYLLEIVM